MKDTLLVFCAHADDEIIGAGGTIVKYSLSGKKVIVVIFSHGELSQPLIKEDVVISKRVLETKLAHSTIGSKKTFFLGIADAKIFIKINDTELQKKIIWLIEKYKPSKIFTHSSSDIFHPDHLAVYLIVNSAIKKLGKDYQLYTFDVWNPFSFIKRNTPKLYVDTSTTFDKKIRLLKEFKSQILFIYILIPIVYLRALYYGYINKCKYAEKFYKII